MYMHISLFSAEAENFTMLKYILYISNTVHLDPYRFILFIGDLLELYLSSVMKNDNASNSSQYI